MFTDQNRNTILYICLQFLLATSRVFSANFAPTRIDNTINILSIRNVTDSSVFENAYRFNSRTELVFYIVLK